MKKVIWGCVMFFTGMLSAAILLSGSMANEWTVDGQLSSFRNLSQYGLMPVLYIFAGIAILGMGIVMWGMLDKED